ncbi:Carboxylesterase family-domain-containing protein, partial [Cyathus striatus]
FITVSPTYCLSSFGFLSHPSISQQDLNAGLQDLIMVFKWVNEYIGAFFGGDPGKVTIMGHSAGGSSVELLLIAKGVEGLFWDAILLCPGCRIRWDVVFIVFVLVRFPPPCYAWRGEGSSVVDWVRSSLMVSFILNLGFMVRIYVSPSSS